VLRKCGSDDSVSCWRLERWGEVPWKRDPGCRTRSEGGWMPRREDLGRRLNVSVKTEVVRRAESEGWHNPEDRDWGMR
jgi:hypothetical protein